MAYLATLCLKKCCPRNDYDCRNSKFVFARHPSFNSLRVAPLLRLICPPCPPPPKVVTVNQTIAFWTSECCQFNHCRVILIKSQSLKRFLKNTGHCWCKFGILNLCHLKEFHSIQALGFESSLFWVHLKQSPLCTTASAGFVSITHGCHRSPFLARTTFWLVDLLLCLRNDSPIHYSKK